MFSRGPKSRARVFVSFVHQTGSQLVSNDALLRFCTCGCRYKSPDLFYSNLWHKPRLSRNILPKNWYGSLHCIAPSNHANRPRSVRAAGRGVLRRRGVSINLKTIPTPNPRVKPPAYLSAWFSRLTRARCVGKFPAQQKEKFAIHHCTTYNREASLSIIAPTKTERLRLDGDDILEQCATRPLKRTMPFFPDTQNHARPSTLY